jgi:hypothetical protein
MGHIAEVLSDIAQFLVPALIIAWADRQRRIVGKKNID